jgi:hypothetical protein
MAETIAPMVAAVGFNTTFASTLEWFPGFVFLLAAAVLFVTFSMIRLEFSKIAAFIPIACFIALFIFTLGSIQLIPM